MEKVMKDMKVIKVMKDMKVTKVMKLMFNILKKIAIFTKKNEN